MNKIRRSLLLVRIDIIRAMIAEEEELERQQIMFQHQKKGRKRKRIWTRKWIERRGNFGFAGGLLKELAVEEPEDFKNTVRILESQFMELLMLVKERIQREDTVMRMALPTEVKLHIALSFLAHGSSFRELSRGFRVPVSSISNFLAETLTAIKDVLAPYMKVCTTEAEWKEVAAKFGSRWHFPRCCEALDGKHIEINKPPKSGSTFYNYKGYYGIILVALVDANYCFLYIDVGVNGRAGDASVFRDSTLHSALEDGSIHLPPDHIIVGDDAFPLRMYLMKRYPTSTRNIKEKVFNYRQSRARNIVENAFGILANRFRIFLRPLELKTDTADKAVWAACSIHNWLRKTSQRTYTPPGSFDHDDLVQNDLIPGLWRSLTPGLTSLTRQGTMNYKKEAEDVRRSFADYFCKDGAVQWQWKKVGMNVDNDYEYQSEEEEDVDGDLATDNALL